ncbi:MAG: hypothetical protein ACRDRX_18430 [Pseudonocardiaceae bacterium]
MNNTIPVTAQLVEQQLEHRVTDAAVAASRQSDRYQAVCGQLFIAASLAAPPGRPCPDCMAVLMTESRVAALAAPHRSRGRRPGLLWRLLRTRSSATVRSSLGDYGGGR